MTRSHPAAGHAGAGGDDVREVAGRIASAVADCPGVARLADGPAATFAPGGVVAGVAVEDDRVRIALVARFGHPVAAVAEQARAAARQVTPGLRIDVAITDVEAR